MINDMPNFSLQFTHMLPPYKHQQDILELSRDREYYGLLWEMGVGKSKTLIDNAQYLFLNREIDGLLVISDKGCYRGWEYDHIPSHLPRSIPYRLGVWSSTMRVRDEKNVRRLLNPVDNVLDILVMNVESFSSQSGRGADFAYQFLNCHHAMMAVDEATSIKNLGAARTRAVVELGKHAEYRRIATGTPITQGPLDLYSMCTFLKQGCLGFESFAAFRNYYAKMETVVLAGNKRFQTIVGYRNLDELAESLKPFTSRILKSECLDLPEKVYEVLYVDQTQEQAVAYENLRKVAVLELEQGLVTSVNALTTISKLHQINCGHIKTDDGNVVYFNNERPRILVQLLENIGGKVVVWGHYQADMHIIRETLSKAKIPAVEYHGQTSDVQRHSSLERFRNDPEVKVLFGTPAAGGKGLNDLVVASTMIYYSNHYNLERRLQSEDRLHRPGQKNKVTIIDLACARTIDTKIIHALKIKKDLASEVLDLYRDLLTPEEPSWVPSEEWMRAVESHQ